MDLNNQIEKLSTLPQARSNIPLLIEETRDELITTKSII